MSQSVYLVLYILPFSDYDAILTEKGDITAKYRKTRELLQQYVYTPNGDSQFVILKIRGNQFTSKHMSLL